MITSFTVDWYNCGLCCGDSIVHEKTTVYLTGSQRITIRRYNGRHIKLQELTYYIEEEQAATAKNQIEKILNSHDWKTDYSVMVCDGFSWEMHIKYASAPTRKLMGTVEPPPFGQALTSIINKLLESAQCLDMPYLFGCSTDDFEDN